MRKYERISDMIVLNFETYRVLCSLSYSFKKAYAIKSASESPQVKYGAYLALFCSAT